MQINSPAAAGRCSRELDGRGSDEPILGNIRARHLTTTVLALLCAPVDDELPRAALRMADREGDVKTLWKGHSPRIRIVVCVRLPSAERAQMCYERFTPMGLRPEFLADIVGPYLVGVDMGGYQREMQKQRERARASWKGAEKKTALPVYRQLAEEHKTEFEGYRQTSSSDCKILAILKNSETVKEAKPGENVEIVLDRTPFYAEAGGQVGEIGRAHV